MGKCIFKNEEENHQCFENKNGIRKKNYAVASTGFTEM